ncbi:MAG: lamin tail domain-containing protein [Verrucomicrobiales bacterium]
MKSHVLTRASWIDEQLIEPPAFSHAGGRVASGFQLSMTGPETKYFTLDGSDPRAPGGAAAGTAYGTPITITGNTLVRSRAGNGVAFVNAPSTWPWSAITEAMFVVEPAPVAITEIMYHPRSPQGAAEAAYSSSDFEFIEIQNTGSTPYSLVGVKFLAGVAFDFTRGSTTSLAAGDRGVIVANLDAFKVRYPNWASLNILGVFEGSLSDGGEPLLLAYDTPDRIALADFDYEDDWYPCTDGEGYSLVLKDPLSPPASWDTKWAWSYSPMTDGSPGAADPAPAYPSGALVINEVLSHQDANNPGDWIELHNTTGTVINIGGWFLSDSGANLRKYTIPNGTVVPAGGFIVFNEHDHFGSAFALSEHGDSVYLSSGSGGVLSNPAYREFQVFGGQDRDVTFGRHLRSNGTSAFPSQAAATPGAANAGPRVGPLVFSEIMYHPPTGGHEYIEIKNISNQTVNLYDPANPANVWSVSGIDFGFPTGTSLGANQTLLLVRNTITPSAFRTINQVPSTVAIFSYSGELDDTSETLILKKPGTPSTATGYVPSIIAEEVEYHDTAPWPTAADGTGMAMERINAGTFADDPANWQAAAAGYGPVLFPLAVISGTGDGAYTAGTVVTIQADTPGSNQAFVKWIGNVAAITNVGSASISFVMPPRAVTITSLYSAETTFIADNAEWRYHDQGQNLGTAWRASSYNDTAWPTGNAQLGYGDVDEATVIGYGGNNSNRHITSYFRRQFSVNAGSGLGNLSLELLRDDGAVIYINGQEVKRDNMPTGTVNYQTLASSAVANVAEDTFYPFNLPPSALVDGVNVIAVEVHQQRVDSSDLSFALRLKGYQTVNEAVLDGDADGMFDAWEVTHFGSTEAALPGADSDGDGVPNSAEFVAGTLPGDGRSLFKIESIEKLPAAGGYRLIWVAVPGRTYSVEWTPDLQTPFITLTSNVAGGTFTDTLHHAAAAGFYRTKVELD